MFANTFKFVHVVVATLYNRVDMGDELEIRVKNMGDMLLQRIYNRKEDVKSLQRHLLPMSRNSALSGLSYNLFLHIHSWTQTREF